MSLRSFPSLTNLEINKLFKVSEDQRSDVVADSRSLFPWHPWPIIQSFNHSIIQSFSHLLILLSQFSKQQLSDCSDGSLSLSCLLQTGDFLTGKNSLSLSKVLSAVSLSLATVLSTVVFLIIVLSHCLSGSKYSGLQVNSTFQLIISQQ